MKLIFGHSQGRRLPVDWAVLTYLGWASILVVAFYPPAEGKWLVLALHVLAAAVILALSRLDMSRFPGGAFLRETYPLFAVPLFYRQVETLNRLISHRYYDDWLLPVEDFLFAGQPSIYLIEKMPWIWFSEVTHFIYFSYLLMIPGLMFPLYLLRRVKSFRDSAFLITSTYFLCFAIFAVIPMESPNFHPDFPDISGPVTEYPMFALVHSGMQKGVTKGAAFPSSHVAMATAAAFCAFRYFRPLFPLYVFLAPAIGFSTVYCRLHYGLDAVVGLLFGLATSLLGGLVVSPARRSVADRGPAGTG